MKRAELVYSSRSQIKLSIVRNFGLPKNIADDQLENLLKRFGFFSRDLARSKLLTTIIARGDVAGESMLQDAMDGKPLSLEKNLNMHCKDDRPSQVSIVDLRKILKQLKELKYYYEDAAITNETKHILTRYYETPKNIGRMDMYFAKAIVKYASIE